MFTEETILSNDFDPVAYLRHTLHLPSTEGEHARLQGCIERIDAEVRGVVTDHYGTMLDHVDTANRAVKETDRLKMTSSALSSASARLRHTIEAPYEAIQRTGTQLKNATAAQDTLRAVQRFLAAVARLGDGAARSHDVHRMARKLRDIEDLLLVENIAGIHVVDRAIAEVTSTSASTKAQAHEMLRGAIVAGRHADVSVALSALSLLGSAGRVVSAVLAEAKRETVKTLLALDPQAVSSRMSEQADIHQAKEIALSQLELRLTEVSGRVAQVTHLLKAVQRLCQRSGTEGGQPPAEDLSASLAGFAEFGSSLSAQVAERLHKYGKKANIHGVLVVDFPRFRRAVQAHAAALQGLHECCGLDTDRWCADILGDTERLFAAHISERQRDKLQTIVAKLNALAPRNPDANVDLAIDPARPAVPEAASPVDARGLLKIVATDLGIGRQDPKVAAFYLAATAATMTALLEKLQEGAARVPMTLSPGSASLTAAQLFHVAMANLAATVSAEVTSIVSIAAASTQTAEGRQLQAATDALAAFATAVADAFLQLARSSIWAATRTYVEDGNVANLTAALVHVLSRRVLLFEKTTPHVEGGRRDIANEMFVRAASSAYLRGTASVGRLGRLHEALDLLCPLERMPAQTRLQYAANTNPNPVLRVCLAVTTATVGDGGSSNGLVAGLLREMKTDRDGLEKLVADLVASPQPNLDTLARFRVAVAAVVAQATTMDDDKRQAVEEILQLLH